MISFHHHHLSNTPTNQHQYHNISSTNNHTHKRVNLKIVLLFLEQKGKCNRDKFVFLPYKNTNPCILWICESAKKSLLQKCSIVVCEKPLSLPSIRLCPCCSPNWRFFVLITVCPTCLLYLDRPNVHAFA